MIKRPSPKTGNPPKRRVFFSFHFQEDAWRASEIRNARLPEYEYNQSVSDNDWEQVKRGGESAIKRWIDEQMDGRSCVVALIGGETAGRKWIDYEIRKAWEDGKGIIGIRIHNLKDQDGKQSNKGRNPFEDIKLDNGKSMADYVPIYEPPYEDSKKTYGYIQDNLADWLEEARANSSRSRPRLAPRIVLDFSAYETKTPTIDISRYRHQLRIFGSTPKRRRSSKSAQHKIIREH